MQPTQRTPRTLRKILQEYHEEYALRRAVYRWRRGFCLLFAALLFSPSRRDRRRVRRHAAFVARWLRPTRALSHLCKRAERTGWRGAMAVGRSVDLRTHNARGAPHAPRAPRARCAARTTRTTPTHTHATARCLVCLSTTTTTTTTTAAPAQAPTARHDYQRGAAPGGLITHPPQSHPQITTTTPQVPWWCLVCVCACVWRVFPCGSALSAPSAPLGPSAPSAPLLAPFAPFAAFGVV